jgi:glyoxylase-like metal-dependent hydrolase (beta-lactamase superfamily II)
MTVTTIVTGQRWKQNCYLLEHPASGDAVVIDPGDDADEIWRALSARGSRLRYILLTHGHYDHVGAAASIARMSGLPCSLHRADTRTLRHAPAYGLRFEGKRVEPVDLEDVTLFDDGQTFPLAGYDITAIHTPGHTPGSVVYCVAGRAFTGDTLFHRRIGRTDLPGGDAATLESSIERLLDRLDDDTVVLPGHGRPSTIGDVRAWWASERNTATAEVTT